MKFPAVPLFLLSASAVSASAWSAGWMEFPLTEPEWTSPLVIAIDFFTLSALAYLKNAFKRGIKSAALALLIVVGVVSAAVLMPQARYFILFGGVIVIFGMLIVGMMSTLRPSK